MNVKTVNRELEIENADLRDRETRYPSLDLTAFLDPTQRTIANKLKIKIVKKLEFKSPNLELCRERNKEISR